ncbi:MAG: hypothetical protein P8104_11975, partial [Gammaproteobacteria bacterium]
ALNPTAQPNPQTRGAHAMTNPPQQIRLNGDQGISQEQLTDWVDEGSPGVSGRQDGSSSAVIRGKIASLF